jgi:hypothetical protein
MMPPARIDQPVGLTNQLVNNNQLPRESQGGTEKIQNIKTALAPIDSDLNYAKDASIINPH